MKIKSRWVIYFVFLFIFLITTPLILLYTAGFRYNIQKGRVQKTGIIIVSTAPRKAQIFLNDKFYELKSTPAEIKNILPGDYEIKIQKEGYHSWSKKLPVYENTTTFAEKIILWLNTKPTIINSSEAKLWTLSSDKQKVIFVNNENYIYSLTLDDGSFKHLGNLNGEAHKIIVSEGKKFIVEYTNNGKKYFAIYSSSENENSKPLTLSDYSLIKWPTNTDSYLLGLSEKSIWKIDPISGAKQAISNDTVDDFFISGSDFYYLKDKQVFKKQESQTNTKSIGQVENNNYNFLKEQGNNIILSNGSAIAIIDKNGNKKTVEINAKKIDWINSELFLYYSDFEISLYNINKAESKIITRLSQPIKKALWHPLGRHIIFAYGNKIDIIEIDDRELRNVTTLGSDIEADFLETTRNGKDIYFSGTWEGQKAIYKMNLR